MKKSLLVIGFTLISFISLLIYLFRYSPQAQIGMNNVEKSKSLYVGMKQADFLMIMGSPKEITYSKYEHGKAIYFYQPPFAASDGIEVHIDTVSSTITRIIPYE